MSQKFRNFRRKSRPQANCSLHKASSTGKLITVSHASPAHRLNPQVHNSTCSITDQVAYNRSSQRLISEFSRKSPDSDLIVHLMKETYHQRRQDIEASLQKTTDLLQMFPFYSSQKWVSLKLYALFFINHHNWMNYSTCSRFCLSSIQ